jgi:hypothetical protein
MKITGTFLDEISHDINSGNWGDAEWEADFDAMRRIGIDTVILIRAGYKDRATFDSAILRSAQTMRPVYTDLVDLFLSQAQRCGMKFFFGLYDSGRGTQPEAVTSELDLNIRFTKEVADRYASRPAFGGWYLSQEISGFNEPVVNLYEQLSAHVKKLKNVPVLISPYVRGRKQFKDAITLEEHHREWDKVFSRLRGLVDIVAFQDGQVDFCELPDYLRVHSELASRNGMAVWSNVETFERGMPINFLPISWPNLRFKMEAAENSGIVKLITFEFSHFMSPHSIWPSAHNLYRRYSEWMDAR